MLDKQDDLDPHRIKLIDGIPNCPDVECLQRVLNRTQKVWNDFGGRKVAKPAAKPDDAKKKDDDKTANAQKKKKACRHWKKLVPANMVMSMAAVMDFILTLRKMLLHLLLLLQQLLVEFLLQQLQQLLLY